MVKLPGNHFYLHFRFLREGIPEITENYFLPVTHQFIHKEVNPIGEEVQNPERDNAKQEDIGSEKKISQEFHTAKLIKIFIFHFHPSFFILHPPPSIHSQFTIFNSRIILILPWIYAIIITELIVTYIETKDLYQFQQLPDNLKGCLIN